jgi:CxxC motif-containing protein (DUF1111 family)
MLPAVPRVRPRSPVALALIAGIVGTWGAAYAATQDLAAGRLLFEQRWTVAPSAFGRWGRGPTGTAAACTDCHAAPGDPPLAAEVRLARRTLRLAAPHTLGAPHPRYGAQLQTEGVAGEVPAEARLVIGWHRSLRVLPDGTRVALRAPTVRVVEAAFGPLEADAPRSLRIAPPLDTVAALAAVEPVESVGTARIGRFGWKAAQPTLVGQTAFALAEDLGITSPQRPAIECPPVQRACAAHPAGRQPEIDAREVEALAAWLAQPSAAGPRPAVADAAASLDLRRGAALFRIVGCADCHVAHPPSRDPRAVGALWSDARLHDLGAALADGFAEGTAGPRDWRTAPLAGLSARRATAGPRGALALLHDGRARSVTEAVLWHGGEARASREAFAQLPRTVRDVLVAWVEAR